MKSGTSYRNSTDDKRRYWRRVLRMAALCHDLGHLPFSHTAEKQLLPEGWEHERLIREIICDKEMRVIWDGMTPPLRTDDLVKLAIGPKKAPDLPFTSLKKTCRKLGVGFWEYLNDRVSGGNSLPWLPDLMEQRPAVSLE